MRVKRLFPALAAQVTTGLMVGIAPLISGCGEPVDGADPADVDVVSAPLYLDPNWHMWSEKRVPVCWTQATLSRSDFELKSRRIRAELQNSWAASGNVSFNIGFWTCSESWNRVEVNIVDALTNVTQMSFFAPNFQKANTTLSTNSIGNGHTVAHEFGHGLGFLHEFERSDFVDDASGACRGANVAGGNDLGTVPDRDSQLLSTYCNDTTKLSFWDHVGIQKLYGQRVRALAPLVTSYSSANTDHFTFPHGAEFMNGYANKYAEGWVWVEDVAPGVRPLELYYHPGRNDFVSVSSPGAIARVESEGYQHEFTPAGVYSGQQQGTIPLVLYYHSSRQDYLTTTNPPPSGYTMISTEGHVFRDVPYVILQSWYSSSRTDGMLTAQDSHVLLSGSDIVNYVYNGMDSAILKYGVQGTKSIRTFYSSSNQDYYTDNIVTAPASYTLVRPEGYVFTGSSSRLAPLKLYRHAGRNDYGTSTGNVLTGYELIKTLGYAMPLNEGP
jgi:hypothetical protein